MEKSSVDIFLELKDDNKEVVPGETQDKDFRKFQAIEISEFKLDGESAESKSKSKRGKKDKDGREPKGSRNSDDDEHKGPYCKFEITKTLDSASPSLLTAYCWTISSLEAADGPRYTTAKISVRKSGAGQQTFLVLTFTGVSVISYSLDVKSETPEETMVFKFEEIEMFYSPQNPDGSLGQKRHAHWDFMNPEENTQEID